MKFLNTKIAHRQIGLKFIRLMFIGFKSDVSAVRASRAGFTVVELLVATTLFIAVLTLVSQIFITSLRSQRSIMALITANDNTFLTLEQMAREMRVGRNFSDFGGGCFTANGFQFDNPRGETIRYRWREIAGVGLIEIRRGSGPFYKITADNVDIENFSVCLRGQAIGDGLPTRVTISLSIGATGVPNVVNIFTKIQTTTSVRNLDS